MDVLVGLVLVVIGIGVCFAGYRIFLVLLPVWAFLVGFWAGSAAIA